MVRQIQQRERVKALEVLATVRVPDKVPVKELAKGGLKLIPHLKYFLVQVLIKAVKQTRCRERVKELGGLAMVRVLDKVQAKELVEVVAKDLI